MKKLALAPVTAVAAFAFLAAACQSGGPDRAPDWAAARRNMVTSQIESRGVSDTLVLQAMERVKRHLFVPEEYRSQAYSDHPLPIGEDQTISQPYIVALMTELLHLEGNEKVLEIGTGSGYQAAVLGDLAAEVYSIEIVEPLAERAKALLDSLGYGNVTVRCGDGYAGWPEEAPFEGIIVTCAPPEVPQPLLDQLADSGRMVVPVGDMWQELVLIERFGQELRRTKILPVRFVPMTGEGIEGQER